MRQRKVKAGDILEIITSRGLAYLQYVGTHPDYGDVIRVAYGLHKQRLDNWSILEKQAGYLAFYPARAAIQQGLVEVVGSSDLPPGIEVPKRLRRAGARAPQGKVLTWIIENAESETVHKDLTDADRQLPVAAIWNHEFLVQRLEKEWSPDIEE